MKAIKHIYLTGNKPLKANKNNIETFLPIFRGFYGSYWDEPDFEGEAEHFNLPANFDFSSYVNWSEYKQALSKAITNKVEELLSDFVEVIEYQNLSSPQYYNFSNDSINCIIRPKKQAIHDYIYTPENFEALKVYLKDNYKSRDGFISSYSYDILDWIEDTNEFTKWTKNGHYLGAILNFIAEQEKIEYHELYYGTENVCISNYYTPEFYEIVEGFETNEFINLEKAMEEKASNNIGYSEINEKVEEIKTFIKDNYLKSDLKELVVNTFAEQEIGFYTELKDFIYIERLIDWQINEIEKHNLTLELK